MHKQDGNGWLVIFNKMHFFFFSRYITNNSVLGAAPGTDLNMRSKRNAINLTYSLLVFFTDYVVKNSCLDFLVYPINLEIVYKT